MFAVLQLFTKITIKLFIIIKCIIDNVRIVDFLTNYLTFALTRNLTCTVLMTVFDGKYRIKNIHYVILNNKDLYHFINNHANS